MNSKWKERDLFQKTNYTQTDNNNWCKIGEERGTEALKMPSTERDYYCIIVLVIYMVETRIIQKKTHR